jgi:hypothetical protein
MDGLINAARIDWMGGLAERKERTDWIDWTDWTVGLKRTRIGGAREAC